MYPSAGPTGGVWVFCGLEILGILSFKIWRFGDFGKSGDGDFFHLEPGDLMICMFKYWRFGDSMMSV